MATKAKSKSLSKRLNSMATPKKRRRRRKSTALAAAPRRRTVRRSRKRTSLSSNAPRKANIMSSVMASAAGGVGGLAYVAPKAVFKNMPTWAKIAWGVGGSVALNMFKYPNVAAGLSGAMAADVAREFLPTMLNDDDLQDTEWVDKNTLSDTGYVDGQGNPVLMSDNGTAYALNQDNDLEELGDAYSLQDDMQNVSMLPLQDAYSLSSNDRYGI